MLGVKFLINLQVGSVRVSVLRNALCFRSKAASSQELPGNHRGGRSRLFGGGFVWEGCPGGFVRPELTFSLVLTPRIVTDPFGRSKPHDEKSFARNGRVTPSVGVHAFRRAFRSFAAAQNDPKKRTHITGAQVLVHISCAERNATVTSILTPVAACIKSLSQ